MFKSFFKKIEETTESIKGSILSSPSQSQQSQQPIQPQQQQQNVTVNQNISPPQQQDETTSSTTNYTYETIKSLNPTNLNYQPMVDAIKGSSVAQALNSSLKLEMDTLKEIEVPAYVSNTMSTLTSSVSAVNPLYNMNPQSIPNVSQTKDSLKEVDLYNGTLLLRNFEVKLKQIRINGQILSERAEEVDKKFPELIKVTAYQHDIWKKADLEFAKLAEVNSLVETIQLNLDSIISKIESLEINLSLDIDNYLDNELVKWKDRKESEIIKFDSLKKLELNKLQEDLSIQHQRFEREKILKERKDLESILSETNNTQRKSSNPPKPILNSSTNSQQVLSNSSGSTNLNNGKSNLVVDNSNNNIDNSTSTTAVATTIDNIVIENTDKQELESFLEDTESKDEVVNNSEDDKLI